MTPTGAREKAVERMGVVWELWRRDDGGASCGERVLHSRRRYGVERKSGAGFVKRQKGTRESGMGVLKRMCGSIGNLWADRRR